MRKTIVLAVIALVLGLVIGFMLGRFTLERQWSQPYTQVKPRTEQRTAGHNPSPKAGTKVLKSMPIGKSRAALASMTAKDPVVSNTAAVGSNDDGVELHVVVENRGTCTVTALSGVAYGFDADGKPSPMLKGGENFVAFDLKKPLAPGKKTILSEDLKDIDDATLALAQIDRTTCSDGTTWTRQ
jgi:uncharacterized protein YneF (UPF0154 family)